MEKGLLIWQNEDYTEFYLSNFDFNVYSFLDEHEIIDIMLITTINKKGEYGPCYSLLYPELNIDGLKLEKLFGMPYTTPLKLNLTFPYYIYEYDVLLRNNLRAHKVIGADIYLENSSKLKNFELMLQQHNVMIPVNKIQPYRLYMLRNNKLIPTTVITKNIVNYLLDNAQLINSVTDIPRDEWCTPPSPVTALTGG